MPTLSARAAVLVSAALCTLVALSGCAPAAAPDGAIDSVTFSQSQAVLNFDDATYTQNDATELANLQKLLDEFTVDPATYHSPDTGGCAGGVTTKLTIDYASGTDQKMTVDGCAAAADSFEGKATDLFSLWRSELSE